ncbi:glycosyltransferase, partial [Pelagibacteraceae bacterium]|nr:glycosyltransferase [Pelagibacteraceae bacterium]
MTNIMPLVSVIINVHNGEEYLNECIQSVLNQSFIDYELILYDNLSTDNTHKIISSFKDLRIKYYKSDKFLKLGEARNRALEEANG